jgi:hypothetical protein
MQDNKITARLAELQAAHAARHTVTVDSLLLELEEARAAAMQADPPLCGAAVSAIMAKAKLMGLDKQKIEVSTAPLRGTAETLRVVREEIYGIVG